MQTAEELKFSVQIVMGISGMCFTEKDSQLKTPDIVSIRYQLNLYLKGSSFRKFYIHKYGKPANLSLVLAKLIRSSKLSICESIGIKAIVYTTGFI